MWEDKKIEKHASLKYNYEFAGEQNAASIVVALVQSSAWFALTPLPDDMWEVTVKNDVGPIINSYFRTNKVKFRRY